MAFTVRFPNSLAADAYVFKFMFREAEGRGKKSMLKRNDRWEYEHGKLISGGKLQ